MSEQVERTLTCDVCNREVDSFAARGELTLIIGDLYVSKVGPLDYCRDCLDQLKSDFAHRIGDSLNGKERGVIG
jgi:hypothetical protein